ncbi:MAG: aspartate aminotransferase family protein [Bacillota bacterium]|nr:aspartate aminotransferase family protein [Bacillota bacterium]
MIDKIKDNDKKYIMNTYGRYDALFVSGEGATLTDDTGKKYIDFSSGIGVSSLGYGNAAIAEAVGNQASVLCHVSNLFYTKPMVEVARKLCSNTGFARVFFGNSGAEANECAIKLARKYSFDKYGKDRNTIITLVQSFHGRTVTTLSATGQDDFHKYFFPFTGSFRNAVANDAESLTAAVDDSVCAIMLEAIQGEGGVIPLAAEFVSEIYKIAAKHDILVIFDEVQTGIGRTGKLFGYQHFDGTPDIVTMAKGLGGGLPIGACMCNEKLKDVLRPGDHGSTFGGNPVSCAAANVVMDTITKQAFLAAVTEKGDYIKAKLSKANIPSVEAVKGWGLMVGIKLSKKDAKVVVKKCLEKGLVVLTAKGNVVRLLPPLVISYDELNRGLGILINVLEEED